MAITFYIVGGYVRDRVLGREAKDHDFVVTGATPDDMTARGYIPIEAQNFPVFHHPITRDEYALARKEKKTGTGYHGFEAFCDPNVTIEEDLLRRDLTCNAMAREVLDWNDEGHAKLSDDIIDPYGGVDDLRNGVLRHVSKAFAEDPVRVLRAARFAAQYNFDIAPETMELMTQLTDSGELDHLTAERVLLELEKALMTEQPTKFFWMLHKCGARDVLFPELSRTLVHSGWGLSRAALRNADLNTRYLLLYSKMAVEDATAMLTRLKASNYDIRMAEKFIRTFEFLQEKRRSGEDYLQMLKSLDAFRQPDLMFEISAALTFATDDSMINSGMDLLLKAFREARKVTFATLPDEKRTTLQGEAVGKAIDTIRLQKIKEIV